MNDFATSLSLQDVLSKDRYIIPIYQRNFAWEAKEVEQLMRDIHENNNKDYYIGTLVVARRTHNAHAFLEVIDGQQRLTAANIIYSVLAAKVSAPSPFAMNLSFENREKSNSILRMLRKKGEIENMGDGSSDSFIEAFKSVERFISEVLGNDTEKTAAFMSRFLRTTIFRVMLHPETDRNHYFEVMNNRGEQLEQHEIVKSKLMDSLADERERKAFATVWDACSQMNGRLERNESVQCLWSDDFRKSPLEIKSFAELCSRLVPESPADIPAASGTFSINEIEEYTMSRANPQEEKPQDRLEEEYFSVIDFPNFLLQVLREGMGCSDVRLDAGKALLREFGCQGDKRNLPDAREFIMKLLHLRVLFDCFIIKRRRTPKSARGWKWAIESPKKKDKLYAVNTFSDRNRDDIAEDEDEESDSSVSKRLCMIQAMFFVTFRRDVYMRWLGKALEVLIRQPDGSTLLKELEDYCVYYIRNSRESDGITEDEYTKGLLIHPFVFNFLDYQLWLLYHNRGSGNADNVRYAELAEMIERQNVKDSFRSFIFTRRNSVEHYLAREKAEFDKIPDEIVNNFGNLALISRNLNSRLNNRLCEEKKKYHDWKNPPSLKYAIMLSEPVWNSDSITRLGRLFLRLLIDKSGGYFVEPTVS